MSINTLMINNLFRIGQLSFNKGESSNPFESPSFIDALASRGYYNLVTKSIDKDNSDDIGVCAEAYEAGWNSNLALDPANAHLCKVQS